MFRRRCFSIQGFILFLALLFTGFVQGAVVTNLTQAALEAAVAEGGTVTFLQNGTINIGRPLLILKDTTLDARDRTSLTLSAAATNRLIYVTNGVTLTLFNLTVAHGRAVSGAGLLNDGGTVRLDRVTFSGNQARGTNGATGLAGGNGSAGGTGDAGGQSAGGAIFSTGDVFVTNSAFLNNLAQGGNGGAGGAGGNNPAANGGSGGAGGASFGGAVYSSGKFSAFFVTFSGNQAVAGSAGSGGPAGTGGFFIGNPGDGGSAADARGGALYTILPGSNTMASVTFSGNSARGGNGAGGAIGLAGKDGGTAWGGAIYLGAETIVLNATFSGNQAFGGNGGNGGAALGLGSLTGNGGSGGSGIGGSVFTITNGAFASCTWTTNSAVGGTNGLAGTGGTPGSPGSAGQSLGGLIGATYQPLIHNSILGYGQPQNVYGTIVDGGYNISSDASAVFTTNTSRANLDPQLLPLAQNNGIIQTVGLRTNSPAIDQGDPQNIVSFDARGVPRPQFSGPDIGAFELATTYSIRGRILEITNLVTATNTISVTNGVSGIDVWADNVRTTSTGTNGTYVFASLLGGSYSVYPTNIGSGFSPSNQIVTIGVTNEANPTGGASNINFIANPSLLTATLFPQTLLTNASSTATNITTNVAFVRLVNFALPQRDYRFQSITNLGTTNWLEFATNRTDGLGRGTLTLTNFVGPTNVDRRFFRTVYP